MNTVKVTNTSSENVAITGFPLIAPGETIEVTPEQADYLILNESLKLSDKPHKKGNSFKAIDPE